MVTIIQVNLGRMYIHYNRSQPGYDFMFQWKDSPWVTMLQEIWLIKSWWHLFTSHRHSWPFERAGMCGLYASKPMWLSLLSVLRSHIIRSSWCALSPSPIYMITDPSCFLIKRLCVGPCVVSWDLGRRNSLVSPDSTRGASCGLHPLCEECCREWPVSIGEWWQHCHRGLSVTSGEGAKLRKTKQNKTKITAQV